MSRRKAEKSRQPRSRSEKTRPEKAVRNAAKGGGTRPAAKSGMRHPSDVDVRIVRSWDAREIADLHAEAGWYRDVPGALDLVSGKIVGSWAFAVAVDAATGKAVGAGRIISDGAVDGYVQELVVTASRRGEGIGRRLLDALLDKAEKGGLSWVGAVGEPGTEGFYASTRMNRKEGHTLYLWER